MANQANRQKNILKYHTQMVITLSDMFSLQSSKWHSICSQVEMMKYVTTRDMGDVKSMQDLCKALMESGTIDYGEYSDLREILVTCNVEAGKIIDDYTEKIRQEREGQPEAKRPRTDEGVGQQQSTEFSPKITVLIERTKAMIEEDKKRTFIATKGFQDAKEKLHKSQVVVIKGNTGDGKTTTAIRLILGLIEEQRGRQPLELHNIEDLDSLPPKSKLITFIDDIFGERVAHEKDVGEWNKRIKSVLPTLCGDKPTEANFLLITIRNEVFNSLRSHSLENVFVDSNIIDLSSNNFKIKEEKLELLELYKPKKGEFSWKENEKEEIVRYATGIGFPQCCRLFRDIPELQKERFNFFKRPFYFLNSVLSKLAECNALLFLFLNDGHIEAKDLDPNGEKVNKTLLGEAFDIDLKDVGEDMSAWKDKQKIDYVRKSLDTLSGFLVVKQQNWSGDGFEYRFAHDSIRDTLALLYGQITPIGYIKYCPRDSLSLFTISKSSPDRIMLSPDNYEYMFERICKVFETSRFDHYYGVSFLDVWTDRQFIERFVKWLNDKNIDQVDVLNKASSSGVNPFVLYLLSEGVKPDKDTDWFSLLTGFRYDDVDFLKKVFIYMNDEMKLDLLNRICSCGFVKCVLYLLSQGVKPDEDTDWWSLFKKSYEDDVDMDDEDMDILKNDDEDISVLKKVVVYMNDEMKLDLLNKACSHGFEEFALYLLSRGVEPDKDTDWFSLIAKVVNIVGDIQVDFDILKDVSKYMNDEMKLVLLNKACVYRLGEFALYLLSQGVEPDKDTDWLLMITKVDNIYDDTQIDLDILKDVFIYMNDDMKLDLLNEACSSYDRHFSPCGLVECVFYLLCQGVKPDEDANLMFLIGCNVHILKNVSIHMNDEMKLYVLNGACCYCLDECVKYLLSEDEECEENTPFCVVKTGNINMLRNIISVINDEIKLVLLNVTCYIGLEECALYLLSEGGKPDKDTPFCVVRGGSVNVLCKLLQYDVIPTARANQSKSSHYVYKVLCKACRYEREEMVTMLSNTYPELVHDTDVWGQSPLLLTASIGNCGIFHTVERVILKSLYRVEDERHQCESVDGRVVHRNCVCAQYMSQLVDQSGDTILNMICKREHTKLCGYSCVGGHGDIFKYLCRSYPALTTVVDHSGCHFLHHMAKFISDVSMFTECETLVKQYLESTGRMYDVTTILDNKGRTVLHVSCVWGHKELCVYLCESYPALTTVVDKDGRTVLHVSCEGGHIEICKYLCQSYPALTRVVDKDEKTVLHVSCERRHREFCKYLFKSYPALTTTVVDKDEKTVLHVSGETGRREICKYLCQLCPDLTTAVDKDGWHCLHYIARNTSNVNMFTECEIYIKHYLESLGLKYDVKTILNNSGQSVLDLMKYHRNMSIPNMYDNPLYDHLLQLFGK
ncbi:uncharacterized protein LOC110463178 [Mizuhopecten yessoensis]|uniref:uncharacterized protein LOC110463178 n=1 Tax=Mizuhopecten yessoensis TaxID=6573 RepID=UPI000B45E119|nr:uncharacterized protein LOC110463178 [Mizuhopecten yessoensis]XP_021373237.1 uncharacterized protein LOC110463178 [Mizuhopecten yessoensis]XP_021373238.1 uncharacterized protein LOC110463178 [Mizuhopecten yessoensis]